MDIMQLPLAPHQSLVLFDGECAVCDAGVMYILDHDPNARFVFAPLQSDLGQRFLQTHVPDAPADLDSMVLFDGERVYTHSTAVLRIAAGLRGPIKLVAALLAVPRALRDPLYRAFAARRTRWFGTLDQCRVPDATMRSRFWA